MISLDHLVILLCLALSGFFSAIEIAYVSANPIFLAIEQKKKGLFSKAFKVATKNPSQFITTMLVGNNIVLVIYGIYMGEEILRLFPPEMHLNEPSLKTLFIQTLISTSIILVTAEFFPKLFSQLYPEFVLSLFIFPAACFYYFFGPITFVTLMMANLILGKFFKSDSDQVQFTFSKLELGSYIAEQLETIGKEKLDSEIQIFRNALEFSTTSAREILIPRTELIAVEIGEDPDILRKKFTESGKSKILIFRNDIDKIIGYIHAFDMFNDIKNIGDNIREIDFVPETMPINQILKLLNAKHRSIAVVLDEYGATEGIITLEDVVEELFGEIEDEHDKESSDAHKEIRENEFEFDARMEVDFINQNYGIKLPESDQYETIGGMIFYHHGDIPDKDEVIYIEHFKCTILDVSAKKIKRIKLNTNSSS
ncbi:MAG: hemolysin family protein [Flavobacteriaceae bacterium]|nr:hemolysin family protein [Flavobacteriaceae bacterium]